MGSLCGYVVAYRGGMWLLIGWVMESLMGLKVKKL